MWQGHSQGQFSHHRGHLEIVYPQEKEKNDDNEGIDDFVGARG